MILSIVLPDWSANLHSGSMPANVYAYELGCELAIVEYGKDIEYLQENKMLSVGGFSDAGSATRVSPLSQAEELSRGSLPLGGTIEIKQDLVDITLMLGVALYASTLAKYNEEIILIFIMSASYLLTAALLAQMAQEMLIWRC